MWIKSKSALDLTFEVNQMYKFLEDHAVFARECALRAEQTPGLKIVVKPEDHDLFVLIGHGNEKC